MTRAPLFWDGGRRHGGGAGGSRDGSNSVTEEITEEYDMWNVRYVGGPLWVSARVFLVPDGVLQMRTTAVKWNIAGLYGPFLELYFFFMRGEKKRPFLLMRGQA